jgi:hypothetical protein
MPDQFNVELLPGGLNTIIRLIHRAGTEQVLVLQAATLNTLQRLKVKRDISKAVAKTPEGSDQIDLGSVIVWLNKIERKDAAAIAQLVVIDATCVART